MDFCLDLADICMNYVCLSINSFNHISFESPFTKFVPTFHRK